MLDMLAELQGAARKRLELAYAPKSKGVLRSALRKFGKFSLVVRGRQLFIASTVSGDRQAATHNEWTFILFVEWLLRTPSAKTGKVVKSTTIKVPRRARCHLLRALHARSARIFRLEC